MKSSAKNKKPITIEQKDDFSVKKELKQFISSFIESIVIEKNDKQARQYAKRRNIYELHIIKINDLIDIYNKNLNEVLSSHNKEAIELYELAYFNLMSLTNDESVDTVQAIFNVHSYINQSLSLIENN